MPSLTTMAGGEAVTYLMERTNGEVLREFKFAKDDWLFATGILRKPNEHKSVEALGLKSLASWEWIPATDPESQRPPAQQITEVTEVTDSIAISAAAGTVRALIRNVENNVLIHDKAIDAYRVPGTPEGVGEEQSVVLRYPRFVKTITSIVVEEEPMARLVTGRHGVNDAFARETYILEANGAETRLTVSVRYGVVDRAGARTDQATGVRRDLHTYLERVAGLIHEGWSPGSKDSPAQT